MVQENLVTNIVAKSDFSDLIADLGKVSSKLVSLQTQLSVTNRTLAAQAAQIQQSFANTLRSTGQFSTQFVSLSSDVEKFGKNLDSGRLKLSQYYQTWQQHAKTSGGLVRQLAQQQVQLQNAILQPLGKNAQGLMQYNVHIPAGLDKTKHAAALARQELQIMNKVMQQGANQLINWGKNTQWAGRQLTVGLTLPLAAFGKAAADAFRLADQELVRLTKVYGGIAATNASDLKKIREDVAATARELSSTYGASYRDTISLAADIAATGKQGNELLKSTQEATRLSILGEVDRQEAMKATLAIQTAFKQNTSQLAESINFLNAVENQTSTSLSDLVEAIPKAGPVVQSLGGSIQDLALYLTAMREGGISASEGANALKSALASLINPTNVAKRMFADFGIDLEGIVTKNAGNLTQTILSLQSALDTLNPLQKQQAIEQLFGKFQFSRLNALFANLGKQGSQTLQVLDLMKASSTDLANIASRELSQITESASGRYRRALETLRADLAATGESFLNIGTKIITIIDKAINFFNKLPDPVKNILGFVGGLTALAGPIIMLTGLLSNFFGYIVKGIFHFKSLFKGGEGWKLLTPEILAAEKAGSLLEAQFYSDTKAANVLSGAIANLANELRLLEVRANNSALAVNPTISTIGGAVLMPGRPSEERVANPAHPLIGGMGTRASMHMNPLANMTQAEKDAQNIFSFVPGPGPVNLKIGRNPQAYMSSDLPKIDKLTSIGGASTGVVAQEAAKWHSMTAALSMQSEQEIAQLKAQVAATGAITDSLSDSYQLLLPQMSEITSNAAQEVALIVSEVKQNKITVDQARARIITLNAQVEAMMAETAAAVAATQGRVANLTTVPLTGQPVVDPVTGRSNMKEMFHKSKTSAIVDKIARGLGVRTYGGGYSIETTMPRRLNSGGGVFYNNGDQVPGPNVNADVVPAMLTPGEFVIRRDIAQQDPDGMRMLNDGQAVVVPIQRRNLGGNILKLMQAVSASRSRVSGVRSLAVRQKTSEEARSDRQLFETEARNFARISRTGGGGERGGYWSDLLSRGIISQEEYKNVISKISARGKGKWVTAHSISPDFESRFSALSSGSKSPYPEAQIKDIPEMLSGVSGSFHPSGRRRKSFENEKEDFAQILPATYVTLPQKGEGTIEGFHMGSFAERLMSIFPNNPRGNSLIRKILDDAAARMNRSAKEMSPIKIWDNTVDPKILSKAQIKAENEALLAFAEEINRFDNLKFNNGGPIPGFNLGGMPKFKGKGRKDWITYLFDLASARRKFIGPLRPARSLTNDDPAHGPLQIGHYWPEMRSRLSYIPPTIRYNPSAEDVFHRGMDPSKQQTNIAWPVGSAEAQAQYMVDQYVRGGYDIMRVPNAAKILRGAAAKRSGKFFRGISLPYILRQPDGSLKVTPRPGTGVPRSPLPDDIALAIWEAQRTGDFSGLIGKQFIMRRSSWSSNPQTARGFGDFFIESDVNNRRMVPMSEMTPGLTFDTPKGKVAVDESEFYFGGQFEIINAGPNGMKLKSIPAAVEESRQPGAARLFDPIAKREKGGPTRKNMPYIVGEKGPELFVPEGNGTIIPNSKLARFKNAGPVGGSTATRRVNPAKFSGPPVFTGGVLGNVASQIMQPLTNALNSAIAIYGGGLLSAGETAKDQAALAANQTKTGILMYGKALQNLPYKIGASIEITGTSLQKSITDFGSKISTAAKAASAATLAAAQQIQKNIRTLSIAEMRVPAANWKELFRTQRSLLPPTTGFFGRMGARVGDPKFGTGAGGMGAQFAGSALMMSGMTSGNKLTTIGGAALMFSPQLLQMAQKLYASLKGIGGIAFTIAKTLKTFTIPGLVLTGAFLLTKYLMNAKKEKDALDRTEKEKGGASGNNVKKLSSGYETLSERIKRAREEQRMYLASVAGQEGAGKDIKGLTLTYKELKEAISDVKKNQGKTVEIFSNAQTTEDVIALAKNYKAALIASGETTEQATNTVYALIKAAGKGKDAVAAIGDVGFARIQTKADAANSSVSTLINSVKSGSPDQIVQSLISASEIIGLSGQKTAELTQGFLSNKTITSEIKDKLSEVNSELGKVVNTADTYASVLNKAAILASGLNIDVANLNPQQAQDVALSINVANESATKFAQTQGTFKNFDKVIKSMTDQQNNYSTAVEKSSEKIADQRDKAQEAYDKERKAIQDKIDLINEETDARLKALDATKATLDFQSELDQAQIEYQNAVALGNDQAALAAKNRIDSLNRDRQYELARNAIEDDRTQRIKEFDPQLKRIEKVYKDAIAALKLAEKGLKGRSAAAQTAAAETGIDINAANTGRQNLMSTVSQYNLGTISMPQAVAAAITAYNSIPEKARVGILPEGKNLQDSITKFLQQNKAYFDKEKEATTKALATAGLAFENSLTHVENYGRAFDAAASKQSDAAKRMETAATIIATGKVPSETLPEIKGEGVFGGKNPQALQTDLVVNGRYLTEGEKFTYKGKIYKVGKMSSPGYGSNPAIINVVPVKKQTGGYIFGPGTGTSDSIPAMLSNGEYVVRAAAVKNIGVPMLDQINRMAGGGLVARYDIPNISMGAVKYANGGVVSGQSNSAVFNFTFEAKIHPDDRRALINDTIAAYKQQTKLEEIRMGRSLTYTAGVN